MSPGDGDIVGATDYFFLFRSLWILIPKIITEQIVVMMLVIARGQFESIMPCTTKNKPPSPSIMNVGSAIPSVSLVRIVTMACGR